MKRLIFNKLLEWSKSKNRKPLLIKGPRQVGKTWIMKELGKFYKDGFLYVNLDKNSIYQGCFNSIDPNKIIAALTAISGQNITTDTLLIFDEIQECPSALNSLKYFHEQANDYHVICAGSLLGIYLNNSGFPVGQVNLIDMGPLTFSEFLINIGKEKLFEYISSINTIEEIPTAIYDELNNILKEYMVVGGMPEIVQTYINMKDLKLVNDLQLEILLTYSQDFSKHSDKADIKKIGYIWDSLPSQLAKENKKFLYSVVKSGARAREYEQSIIWLNSSFLINQIFNVSKIAIPLSGYKDLSSFKLYLFDTGLLACLSHLPINVLLEGNRLFSEFKGSLSENYILQSLSINNKNNVFYYSNPIKKQEIDFLIQKNEYIFPIEIKSGFDKSAAGFKAYINSNENLPFGIRFSLRNLKLDGRILNIPLFLVDQLDKIIDIALSLLNK